MYSATLRSLATFPPELLDNIVNYISNASDLLSLTLTNSTFRTIIIPFHLHYRTVRCFENDSSMWNHLLENQRRTQNVHALELYLSAVNSNSISYRECLPPIPRDEKTLAENPALALSAIRRMTHLQSLSWRPPKFHFQFTQPKYGNFAEDCWDIVSRHCPEVREVVARSSHGCCDCADQRGEPRTSSKLFSLRRLTAFSYTFFCTQPGHSYNADQLFDFLALNPELQQLRLFSSFTTLAQTPANNLQQFFRLQFPSLRTFSLGGRVDTIPVHLLIDFFDAHQLLESFCLGKTISITTGPAPSRPRLLPSLKYITAWPVGLAAWFLGDLSDGTIRPLVSISVSFSLGDSEGNTFFTRMSSGVGEGLEALSISFDIPEHTINWPKVISNIKSACPNLRRLDINGLRYTSQLLIAGRSHPNPNNSDYWISPLHPFESLELLNVPKGFIECLVVRPQDKDGKLRVNQDAMLKLIRTCPSLRLIHGLLNRGFIRRKGGLIYIHPASDKAKLPEHGHYNGGFKTVVELSDKGQSTDFTWQLYSVVGIAFEDLWKGFLPHSDKLRFAY